MSKQKSAHEVIKELLNKSYSYRELAVFYDMSPSMLHRIGNNPEFDEPVSIRDLLNSKRPKFTPKKLKLVNSGLNMK